MPIPVVATPRMAPATSSRRLGRVRAEAGRFTLESDGEALPEAPAAVAFVCPPALLQLQEAAAPEPSAARAALRHGFDLLDRLDDLRLALVAGRIAPGRLAALAEALAARQGPSSDPRVEAVIAEIELRAAVELAKFHRATSGGPLQPASRASVSRSDSKA